MSTTPPSGTPSGPGPEPTPEQKLLRRKQEIGLYYFIVIGFQALAHGCFSFTRGAIFFAFACPVVLMSIPVLMPLGIMLSFYAIWVLIVLGYTMFAMAARTAVLWLYKFLNNFLSRSHSRDQAGGDSA